MELTLEKRKILELLAREFPNRRAAFAEIINLQAILNLPKGTEHYMSDLHGEYEAFKHILNNCAGVIKEKVALLFGDTLTPAEQAQLCTLIYYPQEELERMKQGGEIPRLLYKQMLERLIWLTRYASSKYTRSKVRKAMPREFAVIIDELLHAQKDEDNNRALYHSKILDSIMDTKSADDFIVALCTLSKRLIVDRLHILGDIFDRGEHADRIMDLLMNYENEIDIQWGNHDILWMGAAAGNPASIFVCINNNVKYGNYEVLENGYGISMRNLVLFAEKTYTPEEGMDPLKKAISVLIFKLEGQLIRRHTEYKMEDRMLLGQVATFLRLTGMIPSGSVPKKKLWSETSNMRLRTLSVCASMWISCIPTAPCTSASMRISSITDASRSMRTVILHASISGESRCREESSWTRWTRKSEGRGAPRIRAA